jgi:hypothetical protein
MAESAAQLEVLQKTLHWTIGVIEPSRSEDGLISPP